MPQAGHPSGTWLSPGLDFSIDGFLPSSTFGFSHELMIPAVTATSIAWRTDLESFIVFELWYYAILLFGDNNISGNVANEVKINLQSVK